MHAVTYLARSIGMPIYDIAVNRYDIKFPYGLRFRPRSGDWAGDALHNYLQFEIVDTGLAPMVAAFWQRVGVISDQHTSDRRVYVPGLYEGRTDWDRFGSEQIQVFEFKWSNNEIPTDPRDVDIRQVALYAYALSRAFPKHEIWFRLAYFFGGKAGQPAKIRIFSFKYPKQLIGIASKILRCL